MPNYNPKLSIIIVNYNAHDLLRDCLASIYEHHGDLVIETIVVDNNSGDGTAEMIKCNFPEVTFIKAGTNVGFARANNMGLKVAHGNYILFLNPDTLILKGTLQRLTNFIVNNPDVGIVGPRMNDPDGTVQTFGPQWPLTPLHILLSILFVSEESKKRFPRVLSVHNPETSGTVIKLCGGCMLLPKDIAVRVGGFDDRFFMYAEDTDICEKVRRAGRKVYYLSDAHIIHFGGASTPLNSPFSILMMRESTERYIAKYYGIAGVFLGRLIVICRFGFPADNAFRRILENGLRVNGDEKAPKEIDCEIYIDDTVGTGD